MQFKRTASYARLRSKDPVDERIAGRSSHVSSPCCCVHLEFNKTTTKATAQTVVNQKIGAASCQNLPGMDNLARIGNYSKQNVRPKDPVDVNFSVQDAHIAGGFLQLDIRKVTLS